MKKLIYIFFLLISCYTLAQEYSLNTSSFDVPDNAYIKDINNEYDKYIGVWKGDWNGKTVYLELKKVKMFHNGPHPYYRDQLLGERKIVDTNGNIEIDRISNFDYQHPEFWGLSIPTKYNGVIRNTFLFQPKNMCNKSARLIITNFENLLTINNPVVTTKMTLHFEYLPSFIDENCIHNAYVDQNNDFPINFPKDIVLTKQ